MPRRAWTFTAALLIVATSTAGALLLGGSAEQLLWRVLVAPTYPAWWLLYALTGGPHGFVGEWYEVPLTSLFSLIMWWLVLDLLKRAWLRRPASTGE
jgi:hypothetical protein